MHVDHDGALLHGTYLRADGSDVDQQGETYTLEKVSCRVQYYTDIDRGTGFLGAMVAQSGGRLIQ